MDRVVGQPFMAVAPGDVPRKRGADRAVDVADRHLDRHLLAPLERRLGELDNAVVERLFQAVLLALTMEARHLCRHARHREYLGEIEPFRLPVLDAALHVEQLGMPDQVIHFPDAELRHQLAHFLGDEEEVIDDVLGLALELLAQHRILRRHAHRAGIEVALAHHDAAFDDERRGGEAELVGAQNGADHHVAPRFHLPVDLHGDAPAQAV